MSSKFVVFLFLALIVVGVSEWDMREHTISPIRALDRFWVDFCMGHVEVGGPSITMVRITDEYESVSLGQVGGTPDSGDSQLTRLDYASFLYALAKVKPKAVAFLPTPEFSSSSILDESSILPLGDAALQLPRMTLATRVTEASGDERLADYRVITTEGDVSGLPRFNQTTRMADTELLANGDPAFTVVESAPLLQEKPPRIQLVARVGDRVVAGFALAAVASQSGIASKDIVLDTNSRKIRVGDKYTIPILADGTMVLPAYAGLHDSMYDVSTQGGQLKRNYRFASLRAEDVAVAAERSDGGSNAVFDEYSDRFESLANNLVLVGYDRVVDRTVGTQMGELLSPMSVMARAIATIQSGRHTQLWPVWARAIVYLAIFGLGFILLSMQRRRALWVLTAAVFSLIVMVLIFRFTLSWTPPFAEMALFGIMFVIGLFK